jgi:hypothetical protein
MKVDIVKSVSEHPNADSLFIVKLLGSDKQYIVRKDEFEVDDPCLVFEVGEKLPKWLLINTGLYDDVKKKGKLAGKMGNRVKSGNIRESFNDGVIYKMVMNDIGTAENFEKYIVAKLWNPETSDSWQSVYFEDNGTGSGWHGIFASEFLRDKKDRNSYLAISSKDFLLAAEMQKDINNDDDFGMYLGVEPKQIELEAA